MHGESWHRWAYTKYDENAGGLMQGYIYVHLSTAENVLKNNTSDNAGWVTT